MADDLAQSLKIETNDDEVALLSNDEDDVLSIDEIDLEPQTVCLLVDPVAFFLLVSIIASVYSYHPLSSTFLTIFQAINFSCISISSNEVVHIYWPHMTRR